MINYDISKIESLRNHKAKPQKFYNQLFAVFILYRLHNICTTQIFIIPIHLLLYVCNDREKIFMLILFPFFIASEKSEF